MNLVMYKKPNLLQLNLNGKLKRLPSFTLFGIPNQTEMRTDYAIKIPYALGLIATRSTTEQVTGIQDLMRQMKFGFEMVCMLIEI